MKTFENSQATFLNETEFPLMSSQAGSHAKTLALQESKLALVKERAAGCGPKSSDLLASYDLNSSSWRTSQTCLVAQAKNEADGLAEYSETWPSAGMMRNGSIYQLPSLEPGTNGREYGYLPTPTKSDAKGAPKQRYFGSKAYRNNLCEALRNGPDDPIYPHPDFVMQMMGFPTDWLQLPLAATQ